MLDIVRVRIQFACKSIQSVVWPHINTDVMGSFSNLRKLKNLFLRHVRYKARFLNVHDIYLKRFLNQFIGH